MKKSKLCGPKWQNSFLAFMTVAALKYVHNSLLLLSQKVDPNFPPLGCGLYVGSDKENMTEATTWELSDFKAWWLPPHALRSLYEEASCHAVEKLQQPYGEDHRARMGSLQPRKAVVVSHPGSRPSSPSPAFRWLQLCLTSWWWTHETLSPHHQQSHSWIPDPQKQCERIHIWVCCVLWSICLVIIDS